MKKLLIALTIIAAVAVIVSAGLFGYSQFKQMNRGKGIQITIKSEKGEKNDTSEQSTKDNNEEIENQITNEQPVNNEETNNSSNKVTRDNVFDYTIAAVNEVGDADLLKFQEPEYNGSEWTINANNKSGAGANTIVVKDDGTVQIWNGSKTSMDHETKIEL